jgi:hypothetical protein
MGSELQGEYNATEELTPKMHVNWGDIIFKLM